MKNCRICDGKISKSYMVREMLLGTRDTFEYLECGSCGCLQIADIPKNLQQYYPKNYYSLQTNRKKKSRMLRDFVRKKSSLFYILGNGIVGRSIAYFRKPDPLHLIYRRINLKVSDSILDVGGGAGSNVLSLKRLGFEKIYSVDPFIEKDIFCGNTLIAKRTEIHNIEGNFDLITFHHSLEHMQEQARVIQKASELIDSVGRILIRIPTVTSHAWQVYRENWVNLDAPRHLYLHSHESLKILAEKSGLKVLDLWNDSVSMQFWGSEQYIHDIPLNDPKSYAKNKQNSIFNSGQIRDYEKKAGRLNEEGKGDWICAVLGK